MLEEKNELRKKRISEGFFLLHLHSGERHELSAVDNGVVGMPSLNLNMTSDAFRIG